MFGTPLDSTTVAVRESPETGLRLLPADTPTRVQAILAAPRTWAPFSVSQTDAYARYFEGWTAEPGWWRTATPAVFALERAGGDVWSGQLVGKGLLLKMSDDADLRPPVDVPAFLVGSALSYAAIAIPFSESSVYDSTAFRIDSARVRGSVKTVWARTFRDGQERPARRKLLAGELACLRILADGGFAPEILYSGDTATTVVTETAVGLDVRVALARSPAHRAEILETCERSLVAAADILHANGCCIGPVSVECLRVRWFPQSALMGPSCTILTLPAAGDAGQAVPPSAIDMFPAVSRTMIEDQFETVYIRSQSRDMDGITRMLAAIRSA